MDAKIAEGRKDCVTALRIVNEQIGAASFSTTSDQVRGNFYVIGINCAVVTGLPTVANEYADAGAKLQSAPPELWQARLSLALKANRTADSVTLIEAMAIRNPDALNGVRFLSLFPLYREVKKYPELQRRLLKVLASDKYIPAEPGFSTNVARLDYAILLVESGDKSGASDLVRKIDRASVLIQVSLDPRLRDLIPANFDVRAAVERHLAKMHEVAAAHPTVLLPQLNLVEDLLTLERAPEALATLNALSLPSNPSRFSDAADNANWWWDSVSRANALLGRYDEAVAALKQGQAWVESGQPNVSQTLNLALLQLEFGRYSDALTTLAPIGGGAISVGPYGQMIFHMVHGCASMKSGQRNDAKADLAYVRSHLGDGAEMVTALLQCMGDLDAAAASLVSRLETPNQRVNALIELSDFEPSSYLVPPDPTRALYPALYERPEVRAAIMRAGGVRKFNIPRIN